MTKPRSRHIALNGTIDLADGFVGIALISRPDMPGRHRGTRMPDLHFGSLSAAGAPVKDEVAEGSHVPAIL
jgi:hypothetical protein